MKTSLSIVLICLYFRSSYPVDLFTNSEVSSLSDTLHQKFSNIQSTHRYLKGKSETSTNEPIIGSPNLTVIERPVLESMLQDGCKNIDGNGLGSNKTLEEKKLDKTLKVAIIYSGQVCHGRGADALWDPVQQNILWGNKEKYVHEPLKEWGEVHLFGLFEEMAAGSAAIGNDHHKAKGCNNFAHLVNWTRYEFMPSESHIKKGMTEKRSVSHGEERRSEALYRFIGNVSWETYDLIMQFRPDVMFRKPIDEWQMNLNKINAAHFESNGPSRCDPVKLYNVTQPTGLPAIGDPFIIYPKRWTPIFFFFGSSVMGRGAMDQFRKKCRCCGISLERDLHVLDMHACHNTRSCLYHPIYYLFGERLCGEALRPGESEHEFCVGGAANEKVGQNNCAMATSKTIRYMAKEQVDALTAWNTKHYRVYDGPMELEACMVNSTTGWLCPKLTA